MMPTASGLRTDIWFHCMVGASRADIIMSLVQAERRLSDFHSEDPSFDASTVLDLSIESLRAGGGSITAPIEYAEAYIYVENDKVDMVPVAQRDGRCAIVFADPPTGKHHRRAATPRGDHRSATPRPDPKAKGDQQKGKAPEHSWPKGGGHKSDQFSGKGHKGDIGQGRVTRVTSTKARVANTATNKGSSVVADPPDRELPLAGISLMLASRATGAHRLLLSRSQVRCIPISRWEDSCNSPWLA